MENCRKIIFLFFFLTLLTTFSMPIHAQTTEETKTEIKKSGMAQAPVASGAVLASSSQGPLSVQPVVAGQTALPIAVPKPSVRVVSATQPVETVKEKTISTAPIPSGVIEIGGFKYPVYLYVPKEYKTDRTYSLIMIAPAESTRAQEQVEYLVGLAQRKSIFILAPYVLWPKPGTTPYELDKWLFAVKKDIVERFPIDKKRIYLIGKYSGAHYAAYLATKYPREFSAVALFGDAWDGPFGQLIKLSSDPMNQIPFYVALKAGSNGRARNQGWLDRLQEKGYVLSLAEYPKDETLDELEFKKSVYEWLEEASRAWIAEVAERNRGWKGKIRKGIRDFFTV